MNPDKGKSGNYARAKIARSKERIGSVLGAESPRGKVTVTAANWLTIFRLVVVPFFWMAFFSSDYSVRIVGTILFILGALSDLWDGRLARKYRHVTPFGNFMDPLADKLLTLSAYWAIFLREDFGRFRILGLVCILLITTREVGITALRIFAIEQGSSVVTSIWGKVKTTVQLITIILLLLLFNSRSLLSEYELDYSLFTGDAFIIFVNILFIICAFTSVVSGLLYFRKDDDGSLKQVS